MLHDITYAVAIKNAEHLKALGVEEVYLYREDPDFPWRYVTEIKAGGTWRIGAQVSAWVSATDPTTGLRFKWSVDFERGGSNGESRYKLDVEGIASIVRKLPQRVVPQLAEALKPLVDGIAKQRAEYEKAVDELALAEAAAKGLLDLAIGRLAA
jgi:hypothetical protein